MESNFFAGLTKLKFNAGKSCKDDDFADRLSHTVTVTLILVFTLLISARQYIGKPIACWVPTHFTRAQEEYAESACWVMNTYLMPAGNQPIPVLVAARQQHQITYYQWVPFFLMLEALLFSVPCLIWRMFNWQSGIHLSSIMEGACDIEMIKDPESRQNNVLYVSRHIDDALCMQNPDIQSCFIKDLSRSCCANTANTPSAKSAAPHHSSLSSSQQQQKQRRVGRPPRTSPLSSARRSTSQSFSQKRRQLTQSSKSKLFNLLGGGGSTNKLGSPSRKHDDGDDSALQQQHQQHPHHNQHHLMENNLNRGHELDNNHNHHNNKPSRLDSMTLVTLPANHPSHHPHSSQHHHHQHHQNTAGNLNSARAARLKRLQLEHPTCTHNAISRCLARHLCFLCGRTYGNYLIVLYLLCKLVYLLNIVSQFFLMNRFLGTNYTFYGYEMAYRLSRGEMWDDSGNFPRITLCDFEIRVLANKHRHTVQCVLPINMFNEKIFIFLWFWLVLVASVTFTSLIYWFNKCVVRANRLYFVRRFLKFRGVLSGSGGGGGGASSSSSAQQLQQQNAQQSDFEDGIGEKRRTYQFVENYLRLDGVFILRLIAQNAGELVASEITEILWAMFKKQQTDFTAQVFRGFPTRAEQAQPQPPPQTTSKSGRLIKRNVGGGATAPSSPPPPAGGGATSSAVPEIITTRVGTTSEESSLAGRNSNSIAQRRKHHSKEREGPSAPFQSSSPPPPPPHSPHSQPSLSAALMNSSKQRTPVLVNNQDESLIDSKSSSSVGGVASGTGTATVTSVVGGGGGGGAGNRPAAANEASDVSKHRPNLFQIAKQHAHLQSLSSGGSSSGKQKDGKSGRSTGGKRNHGSMPEEDPGDFV